MGKVRKKCIENTTACHSHTHNHTQLYDIKMSLEDCPVKGGACILGNVSERLEHCLFFPFDDRSIKFGTQLVYS